MQSQENKLDVDSIVKCDQLFQIPKKAISFKLGSVDVEDMLRFLKAYEEFLNSDKN